MSRLLVRIRPTPPKIRGASCASGSWKSFSRPTPERR